MFHWTTTIIQTVTKVPGWIEGNQTLKKLGALSTGSAATLVAFAEDPQEFILGILLETFIGGILNAGGILVEQLAAALEPIVAIPGMLAAPLLDAGALVVDPFVELFATVDAALTTTVAAAGPFAPVLVTLVYAIVVVVGLWVARLLVYEGLPILYEIIVLVIPWA